MADNFYTENGELEVIPTKTDDKEALDRYYKNLGEKIKKAREEEGLTQAKLADQIGITATALANYEAGIRQIPVHILLDIAKFIYKPLPYFFGPSIEVPILITEALKGTIERFTQASYIQSFYEIINGHLIGIEKPEPMIPVPSDMAKDHHFAIRQLNDRTGVYDYYLCKWYKPVRRDIGVSIFKRSVSEFPNPDPEDWIIGLDGEKNNNRLMQFKEIAPKKELIGKDANEYTIDIIAIVLARIERLVK